MRGKSETTTNGFACGGYIQLLSPYPSFLTDSFLVLCSSTVLTGGIRQSGCTGRPVPPGWHIHTCSRKKVHCFPQHSLWSMEEIPGNGYTRRAGQGCRRTSTQQQDQYFLLCVRALQQVNGVHVSDQTVSSIGIHGRTPELVGRPLAPCSLHR